MEKDNLNKSLLRALRILSLFTPGRLESSLTEISELSGLAPATCYRILSTLAQTKFLEKSKTSGKYRVGSQAFTLGMLYLNVSDVLQYVDPVLDLVNELTGERTALHVLESEHEHTLPIRGRDSTHAIRFIEPAGVNYMAHATANGKILLSGLSHEELMKVCPSEDLPQHTPSTISSRGDLLRELEQIRATGVAFNDGESVTHLWAVASPVRNSEGQIVASLSVAAPSIRVDVPLRRRLTSLVEAAGRLASHRLGWRATAAPSPTEEDLRSLWATEQGHV